MTPVRLEHAAPLSGVKHSTTEPLRSQTVSMNLLVEGVSSGSKGFIQPSQCKIQGLLKDYRTAFKDYKIMIYTMNFNFQNAEIMAK